MRFSIIFLLLLTAACQRSKSNTNTGEANKSLDAKLPEQRLNVRPALPAECPGGGSVYSVFSDDNDDGQLNLEEPITNVQVVCNGLNGSDGTSGINGFNTLFAAVRVATVSCASGFGLQLSFGLDLNRNSSLDPSEYGSPQILCDGVNGQSGADGAPGRDGIGVVFQTLPAPANVCASGGSTILMASDSNHTGIYSASLPNQQSLTICNGNSSPVAPYSISASIYACGHVGNFDEVMLRLGNGQVLASLSDKSNGQNTRLAFLSDGEYITTDGRECAFKLSTVGKTRSVSWGGKVQESWSLP